MRVGVQGKDRCRGAAIQEGRAEVFAGASFCGAVRRSGGLAAMSPSRAPRWWPESAIVVNSTCLRPQIFVQSGYAQQKRIAYGRTLRLVCACGRCVLSFGTT